MTKDEIYQIMTSNPAFHVATVDGDQARCRAMFLYKADSNGIVFHTGTIKDIYHQIVKNPNVELCFNDSQKGIQVRAFGKIDIVNDNALKDEIYAHPSRGFLKPMREAGVFKDFYKDFIVFRLKNAKATVWTMQTNLTPKVYIDL